MYICIYKMVERDPGPLFLMSTTPRCRGGKLLSLEYSTYL